MAPSELENILTSHPKVFEAGVCGVFDDSRQTEWPIGYVSLVPSVPAADRERVLKEILEWFEPQVATYKRLRGQLYHIDVIPKNPTGKLDRNRLPARLKAARAAKA